MSKYTDKTPSRSIDNSVAKKQELSSPFSPEDKVVKKKTGPNLAAVLTVFMT